MIHHATIANFGSILEPVHLDDLSFHRTPIPGGYHRVTAAACIAGANATGKRTVLLAIANALRFASDPEPFVPPDIREPFLSHDSDEGDLSPVSVQVTLDAPPIPNGPPSALCYTLRVHYDGNRPPSISETLVETNRAPHQRRTADHFRRIVVQRSRGCTRPSRILPDGSFDPRSAPPFPPEASAIACLAAAPRPHPYIALCAETIRNNACCPEFPAPRDTPPDIRFLSRLDLGINPAQPAPPCADAPIAMCGLRSPLPPHRQSAATRKLLRIAPHIQAALADSGTLVAPALDAGIHASICNEIIRLFLHSGTNSQILFSSTDAETLDILSKESVFIASRARGATQLHRASQYAGIRRNSSMPRTWLSGCIGGLPSIG